MEMKKNIYLSAAVFSIFVAVFAIFGIFSAKGEPSSGTGFHRRWEGKLRGGECYFTTTKMLSGDFMNDPGEELFIVDEEGFGHIVRWDGTGFAESWITSDPVVDGRIRGAAVLMLNDKFGEAAVFLDDSGTVTAWGGEKWEFRKICEKCVQSRGEKILKISGSDVDDDGREELVAWATTAGRDSLTAYKWNGTRFELASKAPVSGLGTVHGVFPVKQQGGVEKYVLYESDYNGRGMLVSLGMDEEGARVEWRLPYAEKKQFLKSLWMDTIEAGEPESLFVMMAEGATQTIRIMNPAEVSDSVRIASVPVGVKQSITADLNGDGKKEMVFMDADCGFTVFTRSRFGVSVNGASIPVKGNVMRKTGDKVLVSADVFKNFKIKKGRDFVTLYNNKRILRFRVRGNEVTAKEADEEEDAPIGMQYQIKEGRLFVDAVKSAEKMGCKCEWDLLSETLKINY